ncbi:MAG TPA: pitrilysin family protein [Pyrinomonadaceae bacterium]|nr:pitrilysin family protein [Pyrinomonadaceae bacterium]
MKAVSKRSAPAPLPPVPFNISQAFRTTLENGLRVVILENSRLPLVSYRLVFNTGDIDDPADSIGLTSATASMLTEGTEMYSSRELAEKVERLGANLSASSSDDFTAISGSALALYNSELLQLIAEVTFRPTFPENELDLYRRNMIENLKFQRSQPSFLAGEQTARLVYQNHPYARISPTAADIEKLTRPMLEKYHDRAYLPNDAVMIVVGEVERESVLAEVNELFGEWEQGSGEEALHPLPKHLESSRLTIVDRPGSAQSNIVLSNLAIKRDDPDYFAVLVMNQVLGAGASSRVFMNLREEKGYTYGAYTRIDAKRLAGDFEATAEVRTAVTGDSLKEFFYELNRIRDEDVLPAELADAKNFLTGVFPIRAETQEGLTNLIVTQELYGLSEDYLQTYRENVAAITVDDVRRVAMKYIHPDNLAIVIVGDAVEVLPQVEGSATEVEIRDTDGNPKPLAETAALNGETADFGGEWDLSLDFQGQTVPVSLVVTQTDASVTGTLQTVLGSGQITGGSVRGSTLSATANTEIQGQNVEFIITGILDDGTLSGTISAGIIPDSLNFTGSRKT